MTILTKKIRGTPMENAPPPKKKKQTENLPCDVIQLEVTWRKARVMKLR